MACDQDTWLEAFSDGPFAITLLVLYITLHEKEVETDKGLLALLSHIFPSIIFIVPHFLRKTAKERK